MTTITPAPIRKNLTVEASPERAFQVFAGAMGDWWLKSHSLTRAGQIAVRIEPFPGGRWYETGADGQTCDWGRVLVWEPPSRLVLIWALNADWTTDPAVETEVEVTFAVEGTRTRVTLEHRKLENYGLRAAETATVLGSPNGWGGLLAAYAEAAATPD